MHTDEVYKFDEDFRNSIATVDREGKRIWIYPKKPAGHYHRLRIYVTVALLSLFFGGPFIRIHGQPLLLVNILERKFTVFGQAFWPQDFAILAVILLAFFVFIILFTVVFGRVWCGWMCPQTLFMEMVFRKIEYWIEGDAPAQRRLNNGTLSPEKILKKIFKHIIFLTIALLISHTVLAYIIGINTTLDIVSHSPAENMAGFAALVVFTLIFYGVYSRFREQACIVACPYGRLQGVLLSKDSIVVAYDWLRGEPRGKLRKHPVVAKTGDCIDCKLCVHVCPTGIDIRNGTQLECVNCTACIDACNDVMIGIGKPAGLIRFASHTSIVKKVQNIFSLRVLGYSLVLLALASLLAFALSARSDVGTTIFKVPGTLYQRTDDGYITNLYQAEFVNKTFADVQLDARVESPSIAILQRANTKPIVVPAEGILKTIVFLKIPADKLPGVRTNVYIGIYQHGEQLDVVSVKFIGPVSRYSDRKRRQENDGEE